MVKIKMFSNLSIFLSRNFVNLLFLAILFGSILVMVLAHENVHQIIYEDYGINSTIHFGKIGDNWYEYTAFTLPKPYFKGQCTDSCQLAHELNEAISYVLIPLTLMLGFGVWILIKLIENFLYDARNNQEHGTD